MGREESMRVYATSQRFRRFTAALLASLLAYALVVFALRSGWNQVVAALLLVGNLPIAVRNLSYLHVGPAGITVHERVRRRHFAWPDIAAVRLRWVLSLSRPQLPEIERTDGTTLRRSFLSDLQRPHRYEERRALLERLRQEAEAHGFETAVEGAD